LRNNSRRKSGWIEGGVTGSHTVKLNFLSTKLRINLMFSFFLSALGAPRSVPGKRNR
jgi:hypothetical protein